MAKNALSRSDINSANTVLCFTLGTSYWVTPHFLLMPARQHIFIPGNFFSPRVYACLVLSVSDEPCMSWTYLFPPPPPWELSANTQPNPRPPPHSKPPSAWHVLKAKHFSAFLLERGSRGELSAQMIKSTRQIKYQLISDTGFIG